jgi:hypothetical protein
MIIIFVFLRLLFMFFMIIIFLIPYFTSLARSIERGEKYRGFFKEVIYKGRYNPDFMPIPYISEGSKKKGKELSKIVLYQRVCVFIFWLSIVLSIFIT